MSLMVELLILWAVLTTVLVVLLIYRGTLTMHEDDQIFLDEAESHIEAEQQALVRQVEKLTPWVRILGSASMLLILAIAAIEVWSRLS